MAEMPSVDLSNQIPCREQPASQLSLLLNPSLPNPSTIVLHGTTATAKSLTVRTLLSTLRLPHSVVESRECITGRHLLERTIIAVRSSLLALLPADTTLPTPSDTRVESLAALTSQLATLLAVVPAPSRFVIVFDGVDKQREAPPTLAPALARLSEVIPNLTVILIVTNPKARLLHKQGVPHVFFPPYTREETIEVLRLWTPDIWVDDPSDLPSDTATAAAALAPPDSSARAEDNVWLWTRFAGAVWDSLGKGAANDLLSLRRLCDRVWPAFVAPIRRGEYKPRDFSRLMVRNRSLFQSEAALRDSLLGPQVLTEKDFEAWRDGGNGIGGTTSIIAKKASGSGGAHELPYYGKFLLVAAFIASHNPARTDPVFFMKMHEKKRRKMGGAGYRGPGRPPKHRGITRKLLGPQPFPMERWLAIFHAIVPDDGDDDDDDDDKAGPSSSVQQQHIGGSADLLTQVATLAALRLIVKASLSSDIMDSSAKWRANVGMEYVQGLAKAVRFDMADYLAES